MLVRFIAEITADIHIHPDDAINSDTIGDYKAELDCEVGNAALYYLTNYLKGDSEIKILGAEPVDEGVEEYGNILNGWQEEYNRKMQKYER